ncbi:hypothetical protein C3B59_10445 [Cryobacterium zongtaii]|uniref:Head-to-tail stopper n=1 Tax=Cryobacterium zongtaii TaxID=1259217 RepID=A0A2S3ZCH0_9MICO|nr:hypothetical protein [Cryobacterium zongtaii]POH63954.1 hypothetical protein C3B59_10445 [Cryobacterium zongtaii]
MLPSFARQAVARVRYPMVDDGHGNLTPNLDQPDEQTVEGCSVQPGASAEVLAGRDAALIQFTVYAPAHADVLASDSVRYNGALFSIDGEPARWPSATGTLDHVVFLLKRWEG